MKRFFLLIILSFFYLFLHAANLDSLLICLDKEIENRDLYTNRYIDKISHLKSEIHRNQDSILKTYELNDRLFDLYKSFACDSAILYINKNIELTERHYMYEKNIHAKLKYASHLSSSGFFLEAINKLSTINKSMIKTPELVYEYYLVCDQVYGETGYYAKDIVLANKYSGLSLSYKDTLYSIVHEEDERLLCKKEISFRDKMKLNEALHVNNLRLSLVDKNSPDYAIVLYYRALIYEKMGKDDQYVECLIRSSICDIQNATKDHASLWMLAQALFNKGDLERAYKYMNVSWNDTKQYNARLRAWQSSDKLSLIDSTYQVLLQKSNRQMQMYLLMVSILSIFTIVFIFMLYKEKRDLSSARKVLIKTNKKLIDLNKELENKNKEILSSNDKLNESNHIKDEYILRFTKLCSTYIEKLNEFRHLVGKMIVDKKVQDLLALTRSESMMEAPLKDLYANFDSSFLKLFPHFIEQFNDLLTDEGKIYPKHSGELNTELRIFALIRLGITDSSNIADFLRYSVNTIYNYRGKVKNKSKVPRDKFESILCSMK